MPIKYFCILVAGPQPTHKLAKSDGPMAAVSGWPSLAALRAHWRSKAEITAGGRRFERKHHAQSFTLESRPWPALNLASW
jgi:hypothetical protein